jgi:hypothetical protein
MAMIPTPTSAPDTSTADASPSIADLEAQLAAAREAEAQKAAATAVQELTLEGLDQRVSVIERRLNGGAAE